MARIVGWLVKVSTKSAGEDKYQYEGFRRWLRFIFDFQGMFHCFLDGGQGEENVWILKNQHKTGIKGEIK